ncbi:sec-independent protein translocase protein TatA [Microbacteriaceae bacterium MWH-Ta3]|nr:sec-independent protein translocase protein TatA [Microbacteriaceae bacterium MWH-Ta3]
MLANLNGWHAVIILVIILLIFGAPKLPGLAKSLGQSLKIFKSEIKSAETPEVEESDSSDKPAKK